jgi:hypothetical protein
MNALSRRLTTIAALFLSFSATSFSQQSQGDPSKGNADRCPPHCAEVPKQAQVPVERKPSTATPNSKAVPSVKYLSDLIQSLGHQVGGTGVKSLGPMDLSGAGTDISVDSKSFSQLADRSDIDRVLDGQDNEVCSDAVLYRDRVLPNEWDRAMARYQIDSQALADFNKLKDDLLRDSWWATSSGPMILLGIKQTADTFSRILGGVVPAAAAAKAMGRTTVVTVRTARGILEAVEHGKPMVTAAKEGVDAAAEEVAREGLFKSFGPAGATLGLMYDSYENMKTMQEGAEFRMIVQAQVRKLDSMLNDYRGRLANDRTRVEVVGEAVQAIDMYCSRRKDNPNEDSGSTGPKVPQP